MPSRPTELAAAHRLIKAVQDLSQARTLDEVRAIVRVAAREMTGAETHAPTAGELQLLQALADSSSVALENVRVYAELETRVRDRTNDLEIANRELETFSYSVSHDLRGPVRNIAGYATMLLEDEACAESLRPPLIRIQKCTERMDSLIDDTLRLARVSRATINRTRTNLSALVAEVMPTVREANSARRLTFTIAPDLHAEGDPSLLRMALENLLSNAWKFTARVDPAEIQFGRVTSEHGTEFFVRDNGVGFDLQVAQRLFEPFQRFHSGQEFQGNGVGLATVQRIIRKHGGQMRAVSAPNQGAAFYFTLS